MIYLVLSNVLKYYKLNNIFNMVIKIKRVNKLLNDMISDIDKIKVEIYKTSTERKK